MPKVYLSENERKKDRIIKTLFVLTKGHQKDLARVWEISQPAVSQRLKKGDVTLYDLYRAREFIDLDEIADLLRKG